MKYIFELTVFVSTTFIQENNIHATRYTLFETEDLNIGFELKSPSPPRQTIYVQYSLQHGSNFTNK